MRVKVRGVEGTLLELSYAGEILCQEIHLMDFYNVRIAAEKGKQPTVMENVYEDDIEFIDKAGGQPCDP